MQRFNWRTSGRMGALVHRTNAMGETLWASFEGRSRADTEAGGIDVHLRCC